ncbi:hypothetical protein MPTK1_3g10800 [Marchantia polymorpha subsp. ruderalis]|uniref:Uncharacterized protein n=2 Tax=Marchantia polymorpha TaxID=3197 RepID=A0AAF6AZH3_MARPO|nr:hypothetical protein MARPO_0037s0116 [Marchantia polymorpha]BBN05157.1 hypothetical protein Mp_3g10800 [Marchantia polymorpha subsp. ruderalis]|eukprot:PTQ40947.1 hypothetical protein MARPO_0037s0116 [Marchantia polymorpha]
MPSDLAQHRHAGRGFRSLSWKNEQSETAAMECGLQRTGGALKKRPNSVDSQEGRRCHWHRVVIKVRAESIQ